MDMDDLEKLQLESEIAQLRQERDDLLERARIGYKLYYSLPGIVKKIENRDSD